MSTRTLKLDQALYEYLLTHSLREDAISAALREQTLTLPQSGMLSSPEQVQLLVVLAKLIGARRLAEVGTFTGYTTLRLALALPNAHFVCCDINKEWTSIATGYWRRAGVAHRVSLRLGAALATLDALLAQEGEGGFDFVYIDADKSHYTAYYERCLRLLRQGGLLAVDNVLWGGRVADASANDADTRAIREFNNVVREDRRVLPVMVPVGDGLTLMYKN